MIAILGLIKPCVATPVRYVFWYPQLRISGPTR